MSLADELRAFLNRQKDRSDLTVDEMCIIGILHTVLGSHGDGTLLELAAVVQEFGDERLEELVAVERALEDGFAKAGELEGTEGVSMLVLHRKVGEQLVIGDGIIVEVMEIRGDRVRLGIVADPSIPVDRSEVRARKDKEGPRR